MIRIALLGDRSDDVIAHRAIPTALQLAAEKAAVDYQAHWIHSTEINLAELASYQGFWCIPNSPYENPKNIIAAIRHARESGSVFLGTCGGYQHAVLEFAQNVLGHTDAGNTEETPETNMPLINALFCTMREKPGQIKLNKPSQLYSLYECEVIKEQYNCGFGINAEYLPLFENTDLQFTGYDKDSDPRAFELTSHKFFIGTAFQPERSAFNGTSHKLIEGFIKSVSR